LDNPDLVILIDATPQGCTPGTLYTIKPELDDLAPGCTPQDEVLETHGMNPVQVLRAARAMGARPGRILLVGCEPGDLGGEEGWMGLTPPVAAALDAAGGCQHNKHSANDILTVHTNTSVLALQISSSTISGRICAVGSGHQTLHQNQHDAGSPLHELSIALSIVEGAEEEVTRQGGGHVCSVYLKLGPLSGVVKEALLFSYDLACEGTSLAGSNLIIEDIPVRLDCKPCGRKGDAVSMQCLQCAVCGSPGRLGSGTELEMVALEMQT
jgi:hydrogenase nickel insertion protein HypA